jgi:hypothetical protein
LFLRHRDETGCRLKGASRNTPVVGREIRGALYLDLVNERCAESACGWAFRFTSPAPNSFLSSLPERDRELGNATPLPIPAVPTFEFERRMETKTLRIGDIPALSPREISVVFHQALEWFWRWRSRKHPDLRCYLSGTSVGPDTKVSDSVVEKFGRLASTISGECRDVWDSRTIRLMRVVEVPQFSHNPNFIPFALNSSRAPLERWAVNVRS